jgi:hypothetical protein
MEKPQLRKVSWEKTFPIPSYDNLPAQNEPFFYSIKAPAIF